MYQAKYCNKDLIVSILYNHSVGETSWFIRDKAYKYLFQKGSFVQKNIRPACLEIPHMVHSPGIDAGRWHFQRCFHLLLYNIHQFSAINHHFLKRSCIWSIAWGIGQICPD